MNTRFLGVYGEELATNYLKENGYRIIDKNVNYHGGEIDIIALDPDKTIVFIEVKARDSEKYGSPLEAITKTKMQNIIKGAKLYVLRKGWSDCNMRFDVITVLRDKIEHIKDAFWAN